MSPVWARVQCRLVGACVQCRLSGRAHVQCHLCARVCRTVSNVICVGACPMSPVWQRGGMSCLWVWLPEPRRSNILHKFVFTGNRNLRAPFARHLSAVVVYLTFALRRRQPTFDTEISVVLNDACLACEDYRWLQYLCCFCEPWYTI